MEKLTKADDSYCLKMAKKIKMISQLGNKCQNCNCDNFICLDFHHLNFREKDNTISNLTYYRESILEKEVEKCILLCGNCHKELHYKNTRNGKNRSDLLILGNNTKCSKCNYSGKNLSSLDFHHRNPSTKLFNIKDYACRQVAVNAQELEDELNKCDVLCRNCHRKEHFNYERYERLKPHIEKKIKEYREIQPKIDRNRVLRYHKEGKTQKEIRILLNCSKGTISGIFKELGLRK